MKVIDNIKIDLTKPDVPNIVYAKQNDRDSRWVYITLSAGHVPFAPPEGSAAIIRIRKGDGTAIFYDSDEDDNPAVIIDGNVVQCLLVEQALTYPSTALAEVNIYTSDGKRLTSFLFKVEIEKSVIADSDIISSDYMNVLTSTLAEMLTVEGNVREAAANYPRVQGGTWWTYNAATGEYEDSGQPAQGPQGNAGTITAGTTTTLPAGSSATVSNVGTDTAAVFNFGIPKGEPGTPSVGDGFTVYEHEKEGAVHLLTFDEGNENIQFVATANYESGDTFSVNATACTSQTTSGEELPDECFVEGALVTCFLNGTVLNFKTGGAGLNYKVIAVASSQDLPTTAKENTIAVVSALNVEWHTFDTAAPTLRINGDAIEAGDAWFNVATSSRIKLNVSKKYGVWLFPNRCEVFDGSGWAKADAYIRQGEQWVPIQSVFYDNGVFGGGAESAAVYGGASVEPTYLNIYVNAPTAAFYRASAFLTPKIDVTNLSVLYFDVEFVSWVTAVKNYDPITVGITSTMASSPTYAASAATRLEVDTRIAVDVSAITGEYFFGATAVGYSGNTNYRVTFIGGE